LAARSATCAKTRCLACHPRGTRRSEAFHQRDQAQRH